MNSREGARGGEGFVPEVQPGGVLRPEAKIHEFPPEQYANYFLPEEVRGSYVQLSAEVTSLNAEIQDLEARVNDLRKERRIKTNRLEAAKTVKDMFDSCNFTTIGNYLLNLSGAGVEVLSLSGKQFTIGELSGFFLKAQEYVKEYQSADPKPTESELNQIFANMGFTRGKVDEASKYGFREAMVKAVMNAGLIDGQRANAELFGG